MAIAMTMGKPFASDVRSSPTSYPFRRILSPVDFDDNSLAALDVAAQIARDNDGRLFLIHAVPMIVPATGMPVYVDIYKGQEEAARKKLKEIADKRVRDSRAPDSYSHRRAGGLHPQHRRAPCGRLDRDGYTWAARLFPHL